MRTTISTCSWFDRIGLAVAGAFVVLCPLLIDRSLVDCVEFPKACLLGLTGLFLGVLGLSRLLWNDERPCWDHPAGLLDLGVLIYLFSAVVATITSISPRTSFWGTPETCAGLVTVIGYVGWYFGLRGLVRGEGETRILLGGVVVAASLVGTYAVLQVCGYDPLSWQMLSGYRTLVRTFSTLGHPNHLSAFAVMVLPLVAYTALYAWRQRLWFAVVVLCVIAVGLGVPIITCLSRGAWLALAAVGVLIVPVAWKRWGPKPLLIVATSGVVVLGGLWFASRHSSAQPYVQACEARVKEVFEPGGRRWMWQASGEIFLDHPITGCGLDCYAMGYQSHRSVELDRDEWGVSPSHAHNEILHTLATQGVLGGLALAVMVVGLIRCAWLALRRGEIAQRGLTWILCAGLLAYIVQIQFNYTVVPCATLCVLFAALLARRADQTSVVEQTSAQRIVWVRGGVIAGVLIATGSLARTFLTDELGIDNKRPVATLVIVGVAGCVLGAIWLLLRRLPMVPAPTKSVELIRFAPLRLGGQIALVVVALWLGHTAYVSPYEASQLSHEAESYAERDPIRSDRLFGEAIDVSPSRPQHYVRLGIEASKRGRKLNNPPHQVKCYQLAERALGTAVAQVPDDVTARTHRAHNLAVWAMLDPSHTQAAFDEYDAALARDPHSPVVLHEAARAALSLKQFERTRHYAQRLHDDHPNFGPGLALLALMDWVEGKQNEALTKVKAAQKLDWRNDWSAYWDFNELAATFFLTAGQWEEAKQRAWQAMHVRPDRPSPHFVLGRVLEKEGNHALALQAYQTALRLNPQHVEAGRGAQRLQPAGQEACERR